MVWSQSTKVDITRERIVRWHIYSLLFLQSDVAAPLMCEGNNGRWDLVGILNGYFGPCGGNIALYSRISQLYNFTLELIQRVEGRYNLYNLKVDVDPEILENKKCRNF